jgi:DNA repair protein RecO (recombination protein O)
MAIQKSDALVLRKQDLRETSLIVTFYTRDFGKIKGILRGVRGSRGPQGAGAALEIFAHDSIVFYDRKRSDIFTVSQCDLVDFFPPTRESLEKLAHATYMIELLDSVTTLGDAHPEVFDLTLNSLNLLCGESSPKRVTRIFEIKLLSLMGLMPSVSECANCGGPVDAQARLSLRNGGLLCKNCLSTDKLARPILPGTVKFIEYIQNSPFDKIDRVKVAQEVGKELEHTLRKFLDYHIERRLKTVDFLKEISQ